MHSIKTINNQIVIKTEEFMSQSEDKFIQTIVNWYC